MTSWFNIQKRILGINARNLLYVRPYNSRSAVMLANNKLATKQRLLDHHLPTAPLYGVIHNRQELLNFDWSALPTSFVLKPNFGLGGNGILIIYGRGRDGRWISADGSMYTAKDLALRASNILDGNYSMSNIPDIAYCEQRLHLSEYFKHISYKGIPDIRVIVFNAVPVMAMLRLPTKASAGKANLHMGGVGVGIDLVTGTTTYGVLSGGVTIERHPDFNTVLSGITIPYWDDILRISIEAQRAIGLGYGGIDIVLDKNLGPVILEVNGHPGLDIQNANRLSLRDRLQRVAGLHITSAQKGLQVCRELFSQHVVNTDLPILGVFETVTLSSQAGQDYNGRARIDTGLASTTLSLDVAKKLGFTSLIDKLSQVVLPQQINAATVREVEADYREQLLGIHPDMVDVVAVKTGDFYSMRPKILLSLSLGGKVKPIQAAIALDRRTSSPVIIGRNDVQGYLINPAKIK